MVISGYISGIDLRFLGQFSALMRCVFETAASSLTKAQFITRTLTSDYDYSVENTATFYFLNNSMKIGRLYYFLVNNNLMKLDTGKYKHTHLTFTLLSRELEKCRKL